MTNSAYAKNDVDRLLCSILCRGCVRLDRGGGYQNVSRCTKNFQDI